LKFWIPFYRTKSLILSNASALLEMNGSSGNNQESKVRTNDAQVGDYYVDLWGNLKTKDQEYLRREERWKSIRLSKESDTNESGPREDL
jgi:hypothetical protein